MVTPNKRCSLMTPRPWLAGLACPVPRRAEKSTFDFIERTEIEKYSQTEKLETPPQKRFLLLPAEWKFQRFLGGATRENRRWS